MANPDAIRMLRGRDWAIAAILAGYQGDWLGERIRRAPSDVDAMKEARTHAKGSGYMHPNGERYECRYDRIAYRDPHGEEGEMYWTEFARAVRAPAVQSRLL